MKDAIKVGFCVAYDWSLLEYALPRVYAESDVIWISMDRKRKTWAGNTYIFDQEAFSILIRDIDTQDKIKIYEDDFSLSKLTAGENEVRQRNILADKMGADGWHIQLDCDEYFVHFSEFVKYLKSLRRNAYNFNVCCPLVTLFKQVEDGFLYSIPDTKDNIEYIQIATLNPDYHYGRRNGDFNIYTNFLIVHQSWARSEYEIQQKIENWGHNQDFSKDDFLNQWKSLDKSNYMQLSNFHPLIPEVWSKLNFIKSTTVKDLLVSFDDRNFPSLNSLQLIIRNSLFISRLKMIWKKVKGLF